MQDAFKDLNPQQLARLIQYAEGTTSGETPDGATLHAEKNAPWVNGNTRRCAFRPTRSSRIQIPVHSQWLRADEQYHNALRLRFGAAATTRSAPDSPRRHRGARACMRASTAPKKNAPRFALVRHPAAGRRGAERCDRRYRGRRSGAHGRRRLSHATAERGGGRRATNWSKCRARRFPRITARRTSARSDGRAKRPSPSR